MGKKFLSKIWRGWKKLGLVMGNVVSRIILTLFYFSVFAIVGIIFRLFSRRLEKKISNFLVKAKTISDLMGFKNES